VQVELYREPENAARKSLQYCENRETKGNGIITSWMGEIIWNGRSRKRRNKDGGSITQGKGGVRARRKERDKEMSQ
jgi:hypothetical protein